MLTTNKTALDAYAFFLPNRINLAWSGVIERYSLHDLAQWVERGVAASWS